MKKKKELKKNNETQKKLEILRFVPKIIEVKISGIAMIGIKHANPLYIVKDNRSIYKSLLTLFEEKGIVVKTVDEAPDDALSVLYLKGLDTSEKDSSFNHWQICKTSFLSAQKCAKNLLKDKNKIGLFITVQNTGGDFSIQSNIRDEILGASLSGLVKTASLEWENASVKAIDIECQGRTNEDIAQAIFNEIIFGGEEIEVGLKKNGKRVTVVTENIQEIKSNSQLQDNDVVLVSGGARGVTSACIYELILKRKLRIAIFGRTELLDEPYYLKQCEHETDLKKTLLEKWKTEKKTFTPIQLTKEINQILACREVRKNLEQIENSGSEVKYFNIDISNFEKLKEAINNIREEWGEIRGIIHAAGVLADKLIYEQTEEQFEKVFNPKVIGFYNLLEATAKDRLTHICCFSSVAARFGNRGQVAYSMANEILNKACKKEYVNRYGKCLVKSINWGPWDGGMVTPSLKTHFESSGISLIPVTQGAELFVQEIINNDSTVEVIIGSPIKNFKKEQSRKKWLLHINKDSHPYFESHTIRGTPVIPAVYPSELCLKLAKTFCPEETLNYFTNLKALKGIMLKNFHGKGDWLYVNCSIEKRDNEKKLFFEIVSAENNIKHYSLEISSNKTPNINDISYRNRHGDWQYDVSYIYNNELFHGKDFQIIRNLLWIDGKGCAAILKQEEPLDIRNYDPDFNTAIFDGGVQLALLWGRHELKITTLPTGYREIILFNKIEYGEYINCVVDILETKELVFRSNVTFFNSKGNILAQLNGLLMHGYKIQGENNV